MSIYALNKSLVHGDFVIYSYAVWTFLMEEILAH